jgi:hypothetical protein
VSGGNGGKEGGGTERCITVDASGPVQPRTDAPELFEGAAPRAFRGSRDGMPSREGEAEQMERLRCVPLYHATRLPRVGHDYTAAQI